MESNNKIFLTKDKTLALKLRTCGYRVVDIDIDEPNKVVHTYYLFDCGDVRLSCLDTFISEDDKKKIITTNRIII